jgi:membrane associated rhomboid family serine protease
MRSAKVAMRRTSDAVQISATIVLVLFIVFYVNIFLGGILYAFGVHPRTSWGLLGILFSPLLHGNAAHLTANAISLFLLLVILFLYREYKGDRTLILIWLLGGIGTWLIGRSNTTHIGASGVIYGLVTYLICAAWWLRSWRSAMMAIAVFLVYGGIFYGVLPQRGIISWEGHLSGAIAGWLVARKQHS